MFVPSPFLSYHPTFCANLKEFLPTSPRWLGSLPMWFPPHHQLALVPPTFPTVSANKTTWMLDARSTAT
jgi:hypothetical protein